jgi:hypothetical protein
MERRTAVGEDELQLERIRKLVDEEHRLRSAGEPVDQQRLRQLEEMLDQCWDLLRQRRALREYGEDDDQADARDVNTVEGYLQ